MQPIPDVLFGSIMGLIGVVFYAISVVIYRSQREEIRPLLISSLKMWIALPIIAFAAILFGQTAITMIPLETVVLLAASVILGAVVGDTIYLMSQERIGVSYAFPIAMSFPIFTFAFTIWFLQEPFIVSRLIGTILAILGITVISSEQSKSEDLSDKFRNKRTNLIGVGMAFLTAILYAIATTILQVGMYNIDVFSGNFIRLLFGSAAFLPIVSIALRNGMALPSRKSMKIVAMAAFFGMGLGSLLYVASVKYAGAAITSVIASSAPIFAVPISVIFLKEELTKLACFGIVITIVGVILVVLGI